jgi:hypothetical protein
MSQVVVEIPDGVSAAVSLFFDALIGTDSLEIDLEIKPLAITSPVRRVVGVVVPGGSGRNGSDAGGRGMGGRGDGGS